MRIVSLARAAVVALFVVAVSVVAQAPPRQPNEGNQTNPPAPTPSISLQPRATTAPQQPQDAAQQIEAAKALLQKKETQKALQILVPLAKGGNAEAQCLLGLMLQKGYGVAADPAVGLRWYTLAALQGHVEARFMLGQLYYNGQGTEKDLGKAADLFLLVASTGQADGQWAFGLCVAGGEGRRRDPIEGHAWLTLAARQGHAEAKRALDSARLSPGDAEAVRTAAATLQELITQRGFDENKLPKVPVPDGMVRDAGAMPEPEAAGPTTIQARMDIQGEMLANGDLRGTATVVLPEAVFREMRKLIPDARLFLRDLSSARSNQEIAADAKARYEDNEHKVVLDLHMLGAVENRGDGEWRWQTENHAFVGLSTEADGRQLATFDFTSDETGGIEMTGRAVYRLPAGASDARWNDNDKKLSYQLPYTGPKGTGRLKVQFDVRDRIMSCLYKVYGLDTGFAAQWVAKAVFTNTGDGVLRDLRVRFRLGDYSELDLWHKVPELIPGQTAVAVYHPVLKKQIAELTSTTPVNLVAEWQWTDASGKERDDSDGRRISVLGRHEYVFSNLTDKESTGSYFDAFSNSDFVAAWVTRDDPVVKQFAAAANKAASGAGAPYSDEAAWKVLKACYELWLANDFTYQGPVGLADKSLSFDNKIVQSMKFPRDVIRDRSGTCIELSALYCAMAHAVGLKPCMVLIPGHAFPAIRLPSGNLLPVEATGIGGGKRQGSAPFEKCVEVATANYQKHGESGDIIVVDIADAWLKGVANPELEALPADILQRWGTVLEFRLSPDQGGGGGAADPFAGAWSGTALQPLPTGGHAEWQMVIGIDRGQNGYQVESAGETRVANGWGGSDHYQFRQVLEGQLQNGVLVLRGTQKTLVVNGQQQMVQTDTMTLQERGGHLVGELRLPTGTIVTIDVQRQQQQQR
ncbi:MAG: sel1 repeat family protein [Planctomycetes bacterium]|nr:sel1 repeat family protein [Planctomycetota bacterium]